MKITKCIILFLFCMIALKIAADPTRPASYKTKETDVDIQPLKVTMIVKRENIFRAMVAGKSVVVGSVVRGFTVTKITSNKVVLQSTGDANPLELYLTTNIKVRDER